ncbi:hypothetical protein HZA96_02695 [Candidatus Woesearchaeota archaeon]|nr:hypothetical protein [Candidatus Woesearchaeota archaeon]
MYEQQLKDLGLTSNEVRIYLLLLQHGMMNPGKISQKLGLHRGYVYDALERMQEKEVVNTLLQNDKKHYQATAPENIAELLLLKLENFKKIVPSLQKMITFEKEDTNVQLHKGKRVYRILLKDIISTIKKNETVYLIGVDENILLTEVEPIYLKQYFTIIKEKGIKEKVIIKKGAAKVTEKNVQHKEIDAKYIGNTEQIIYGNKVALFLIGNPYYLVIIENKQVAETYRKQFELLWSVAK